MVMLITTSKNQQPQHVVINVLAQNQGLLNVIVKILIKLVTLLANFVHVYHHHLFFVVVLISLTFAIHHVTRMSDKVTQSGSLFLLGIVIRIKVT